MSNKGTPLADQNVLDNLLRALPAFRGAHAPGTSAYSFLKQAARQEIEKVFSSETTESHDFGPFGPIAFPYLRMGAVDSLNLFDIDELIIFSFYWANRQRYRKVLDIGANIGLHSLMLAKAGFDVKSYEPDPFHFGKLQNNLSLNGAANVEVHNAAVSDKQGELEFVRVLGNTTGSHLKGSKPNPYGELEEFSVSVLPIQEIIGWADLIKLDAEGHEAIILLATTREDWEHVDALVEIGSEANARDVYDHLRGLDVNLFVQKKNWEAVTGAADMPSSHREGTLFVTARGAMPWGD